VLLLVSNACSAVRIVGHQLPRLTGQKWHGVQPKKGIGGELMLSDGVDGSHEAGMYRGQRRPVDHRRLPA